MASRLLRVKTMHVVKGTMPSRRHPRYPVRAPALIELANRRGRRLVRGQLSDVSRAGMGLRAVLPSTAHPGEPLTIRFWIGGRAFSVPAELVWTRRQGDDDATLGVRLELRRARPEARKAFRRWTAEVERSRPTPGALPPREQLECRLAALTGSLDQLLQHLESEDSLDASAIHEVDLAAERLQQAITALELKRPR